ncbi:hypothetical protein Q5O14_14115 [Eubacteriaceae bacterium ES2]|nr:hypothetical protein Q5O14_14115 [Eubacteriaceae bacterium ES2]
MSESTAFDQNQLSAKFPDLKNKNVTDILQRFTEEQAVAEAKRCLSCPTRDCVSGCPVQINIPEFIAEIAERNFEKAYAIIAQSCSHPSVCGGICPQEAQCEKECVRGIKDESVAIGRLERFAADYWY